MRFTWTVIVKAGYMDGHSKKESIQEIHGRSQEIHEIHGRS